MMVYYKEAGGLWTIDTFLGTFGMSCKLLNPSPAKIDLLKVNNRNTRTISKVCLKLNSVSIVDFEQVNGGWVGD